MLLTRNIPMDDTKPGVFASALGIEHRHADVLAEIIKSTLTRSAARKERETPYGDMWVTYHDIVGLNGNTAIVTVVWIFPKEEPEKPKLVSCYIETQNQNKLRQLLQ